MMKFIHMMSEHGDHAVSGIINKVGLSSIALGAGSSASKIAVETQNETWLTITDIAGIVSIVGGVVFIFKLLVDIYYTRQKNKREKVEHELQTKQDKS